MTQKIKDFFTQKRCKKLLKNNRGFSLMEVLVAVGIIAIISSIAVTTYQGNKKQAAEVVASTSASNILRAHNACLALKEFSQCDSMSDLGIDCADCNEGQATSGNKFCVGVTKKVGSQELKICVGKDGDSTQRTIGGNLLADVQLCHIKKTVMNSGTCSGGAHPARPTANFKNAQITITIFVEQIIQAVVTGVKLSTLVQNHKV